MFVQMLAPSSSACTVRATANTAPSVDAACMRPKSGWMASNCFLLRPCDAEPNVETSVVSGLRHKSQAQTQYAFGAASAA